MPVARTFFILVFCLVTICACSSEKVIPPVRKLIVALPTSDHLEFMDLLLAYGQSYDLNYEKVHSHIDSESNKINFVYLSNNSLVMTVLEGNEEGEFYISFHEQNNVDVWKNIYEDMIIKLENKWPDTYEDVAYNVASYDK